MPSKKSTPQLTPIIHKKIERINASSQKPKHTSPTAITFTVDTLSNDSPIKIPYIKTVRYLNSLHVHNVFRKNNKLYDNHRVFIKSNNRPIQKLKRSYGYDHHSIFVHPQSTVYKLHMDNLRKYTQSQDRFMEPTPQLLESDDVESQIIGDICRIINNETNKINNIIISTDSLKYCQDNNILLDIDDIVN